MKFNPTFEAFQPNVISPNGFFRGYPIGGIVRAMMPQLSADSVGELHKLLGMAPKPTCVERASNARFKLSQIDTPEEKIQEFICNTKLWQEVRTLPIYVSQDEYILDGHTRWIAAARMNDVLHVIEVPLPANTALAIMWIYNRLMVAEGKQQQ